VVTAPQEHEAGLVVTLVGVYVLLMVIAALVAAVSKKFRIPFTVALVTAGALLGWWAEHSSVLEPLRGLDVTPDAVFFLFLPTLIFQSAFHLDARALRANLAPTLTLAVPGLLISTGMIGLVMRVAGPMVGVPFTWPEALLLGSILSATDPVAVISMFGQLGAPKRLTILVEGESLFNDATAIVLSRIILAVMAAGVFTTDAIVSGAIEFGTVFFGGLLAGSVLALATGLIIARVRSDSFIEITATIVLAYFSFYVAEHSLHLSGVMAVVAAGVLIGGWGKTKISPSIASYLEHFWDYLAGVANALIFLLVGLTVHVGALVDSLPVLFWVIAAMLVSRAVVIFALVPMVGRLPGTEPVSRPYQAVMYWGGLRGAIALAIALSLPDELALKEMFVTLTTGAVLFTLLVQGLTIEKVVRHFHLHVATLSDRFARFETEIEGRRLALESLSTIESEGLFAPRVASTLRRSAEEELRTLIGNVRELRERELDDVNERRILYLRSFGTEKSWYFDMFSRGHLTEAAYRDLVHSLELQADAVRYDGHLPDYTLHPPSGDRLSDGLHRGLSKLPLLSGMVEARRESRAIRDYEVAGARFLGAGRVVEDLRRHRDAETHRAEVLEDVVTHYRYWKENAHRRLDQTAELFPEFVGAAQDRLAGRLELLAERQAVEDRVRAGALPHGVSAPMLEGIAERLENLKSSRAPRLQINPEHLLGKVPFFEGLPQAEFGRVATRLRKRTAPTGEAIVRQGEKGSSLFLVARGVVRVSHVDGKGERDVATLMAGDFFGEMALLHGGARSATCRAVTPCALYELARSDVDAVLVSCPGMRDALEEASRVRSAELARGTGERE
jgi:Na+:H+ antiporter